MPEPRQPRPRRPHAILASGLNRAGLYLWRLCSGHGAPTLTPLNPVCLLPRLLGAFVVPVAFCATAAWRAAWRLLERS